MIRVTPNMKLREYSLSTKPTDNSSLLKSISFRYVLSALIIGMITNRFAEIQSYLIILPLLVFSVIAVGVKAENLPSYALAAFSFTPIPYLTIDSRFHIFSPINLFLLIILIRGFNKVSISTKTSFIFIFGLLAILSTYSIFPERSTAWSALLIIALLTLKIKDLPIHKELFFLTIRNLTIFLTVITFVEYLTKSSIFNLQYPKIWSGEKYWAIWRTTSTLGHPINNGLFFCLLLSFFCLPIAQKHIKSGQIIFLKAILLANILTTGSRSALLAALIILVISSLQKDNFTTNHFSKYLLWSLSLLLIIPLFEQFLFRQNSREGIESTQYRLDTLRSFGELIQSIPTFGFGPGMGSQGYRFLGNNGILESGIGQIILAFGLTLSVSIFVVLAIVFITSAFKHKTVSFSAIPFIVIFLTSNFINDNLTFLSIGVLSIIFERSLRE